MWSPYIELKALRLIPMLLLSAWLMSLTTASSARGQDSDKREKDAIFTVREWTGRSSSHGRRMDSE